MKTIIYLTNNVLEPGLSAKVQEQLIRAAGDNPIISVSQKPMELGHNICVGDIGSSWYNIYVQQLEGLRVATTKYVAIAEHDVFYTDEHFNWEPPRDDTFYYNGNHYLVEWGGNHPELNGMYSRLASDRKALSQLICDRELLIASIEERMELLNAGIRVLRRLGEPGAFPPEVVKAAQIAVSGQCTHTQSLLDHHLTKFRSENFRTELANLDVRHSNNFTGPRRGKHRTYSVPYWGEFKTVMGQ